MEISKVNSDLGRKECIYTGIKLSIFRVETSAPRLSAARFAQTLIPKGGWGAERGFGSVLEKPLVRGAAHPLLCTAAQPWSPTPREKLVHSRGGVMDHQRPP